MSHVKKLNLTQIGLYNPQRLSDDVVEKTFIVRKNKFNDLIEKIKNETINSIPQHHLIIAQRGMGKSTLLKRIEVALRKEELAENYIPLLFPEEQYNISNLSSLWLNCLDALADTLEIENNTTIVKEIDEYVAQVSKENDEVERANQAHAFLQLLTKQLHRRLVLLIDNMNIVLGRLSKQEQHKLRNILTQNSAPIIIGASAVAMDETNAYMAPFYDAFDSHFLKKLTFEELLSIIVSLAELTDAKQLQPEIYNEIGRLQTLHQLTGGNPRTAVMLFKLIVNGFSTTINEDLEALLDEITPLYKARFEELPTQAQQIIDVVALHWEPINIAQLRQKTGLENNQLSPQLKRLYEVGWLEKQKAYNNKGAAYQISERFFNIWFLMRRSSRRQKKTIICLSRFLEMWYGPKLDELGKNRLHKIYTNPNQVIYDLAIADVLQDKIIAEKLKKQSLSAVSNQYKDDENLNWLVQEEGAIYETISINQVLDLIKERKYIEAEKLCLKKIELNPNNQIVYYVLGGLYQHHLKDLKKSEEMYLQAIKINPNDEYPYNNLGNLYQNYLKDYKKSEEMYLQAIKINPDNEYPKYNLIFLYRDHLNKISEAKKIFTQLSPNKELEDVYYLTEALFFVYEHNLGLATNSLTKAFSSIDSAFNPYTQDDWWKAASIVYTLGHTAWFLEVQKNEGVDKILTPYYIANKALLEKDRHSFINSKAVELRKPALEILENIEMLLEN